MRKDDIISEVNSYKEKLAELVREEAKTDPYSFNRSPEREEIIKGIEDVLLSFKLLVYSYDKDCPLMTLIEKMPQTHDITLERYTQNNSLEKVNYLMDKFIWYLGL